MSHGNSSRPSQGSGTDTRRMLDELDALMERMLALPVDPPETPAGPAVPHELLPKLSATLTLLEQTVDEPPETPAAPPASSLVVAPNIPSYVADLEEGLAPLPPGTPSSDEPAPAPTPSAEPPRESTNPANKTAPAPAAAPEPDEVEDPDVPPPLHRLPVPEITPLPLRPRRWTSLALLPLIGVNLAWDFASWLIGPPGRWLRTPAFKNLLGVAGIALLALAAGWLLKDWMGWTW